ncbi:MAG: dipeptidyl peptidase 3, partial [Muribaculaceae bacterium]|nr:dipeptidyl peptidase 3 [Muribaculaceae bacterium]
MNHLRILAAAAAATALWACNSRQTASDDFDYHVDRFADIEVLRYQVPDFDSLSVNQKALVYYLTEAALWGRDIMWDQNCAVNLPLRRTLEEIYTTYDGDRESADFKAFETYMKQVWFGNGIHHHYSTDKFTPAFSREFFAGQLQRVGAENADELTRIVFDPEYLAKRVNQADNADLIATSACNFYGPGLTQAEVEAYYANLKDTTDLTPISYGLNSRLVKGADGKIQEQVYKLDGLYGDAIAKIVENLNKAKDYAENDAQRAIIEKLVDFYTTGDLKTFDDYSIAWAEDTDSQVDFINGFIESYGDPLGMTGSWESIVNFKNIPASRRTETLSSNAQWFEDHSPVDPSFR